MVLHGLGSLCDSIPRYGGLQQELTALCKHKSFIITLSSTSGEEIYKMYIKNPQKSKVSFRGSKHFYFSVGRGIQFRVVFFFFCMWCLQGRKLIYQLQREQQCARGTQLLVKQCRLHLWIWICHFGRRLNRFVRSSLGVRLSSAGHGEIMGTAGVIILSFPPAAVPGVLLSALCARATRVNAL